jgi:ABC-type polysaccharide/polyol phosphate export permease
MQSAFSPIGLLQTAYRHRSVIGALAMRDFQSRYAGTAGGALWAVLHPLAITTVFYFVFAVGFRAQGPSGTPFVLWFVCGLIPWFFFNDTLLAISRSVTGNSHLVKKTVFPTEVLPLVQLGSGLLPHLVFMLVLAGLMIASGVTLSVSRLLFVYFTFCACVLLLGLGWLLSALQVFFKDVAQGLTIILNLWFWMTPIVWPLDAVPAQYRHLLMLNPAYYIIDGYRGMLVFDRIGWPDVAASLCFWGITCVLLVVGAYVFHRLKPEFADVI